jgi:hypothetical protein
MVVESLVLVSAPPSEHASAATLAAAATRKVRRSKA